MVASLRGSVGTGTKGDESSTGSVWAAGFHHFTARSRLARVFKLTKRLFLLFSNFFSGRGQPRVTETADTKSADAAVHVYVTVRGSAYDRASSPFLTSYSELISTCLL